MTKVMAVAEIEAQIRKIIKENYKQIADNWQCLRIWRTDSRDIECIEYDSGIRPIRTCRDDQESDYVTLTADDHGSEEGVNNLISWVLWITHQVTCASATKVESMTQEQAWKQVGRATMAISEMVGRQAGQRYQDTRVVRNVENIGSNIERVYGILYEEAFTRSGTAEGNVLGLTLLPEAIIHPDNCRYLSGWGKHYNDGVTDQFRIIHMVKG